MKTYPKILGYLGVLPFLLCLLGLMFFNAHPVMGKIFIVFQISYSSMIVSFLGGVHWPLALKNDDKFRLTLCMAPTVISIFVLLYAFLINPVHTLLVWAMLFFGVYILDKKYADESGWNNEYLIFRRNITLVVTAILLITFGVSI